jgi:hypothetical protein
VRQFKSRVDEWRQQISAADRKRKLFDDLFADESTGQRKKRARSDKTHHATSDEATSSDKVEQILGADTKWASDKHKRAMRALMGGLEAAEPEAAATVVAAAEATETLTTKESNKSNDTQGKRHKHAHRSGTDDGDSSVSTTSTTKAKHKLTSSKRNKSK